MEHPQMQQQHLLIDLEDTYIRASHGKRFGNYIIDILAFYGFMIMAGVFLALVSPQTIDQLDTFSDNSLLDRFISLILYALFIFAQEAIFKGRSIGKFITGTRAVNLDGKRISTETAMLRALSRAVPFCAFSAFGTPCNPWQDKWTDTMVIDVKASTNLDATHNYNQHEKV